VGTRGTSPGRQGRPVITLLTGTGVRGVGAGDSSCPLLPEGKAGGRMPRLARPDVDHDHQSDGTFRLLRVQTIISTTAGAVGEQLPAPAAGARPIGPS
jgi:hypothetical protein